jgi:hypothetical protein
MQIRLTAVATVAILRPNALRFMAANCLSETFLFDGAKNLKTPRAKRSRVPPFTSLDRALSIVVRGANGIKSRLVKMYPLGSPLRNLKNGEGRRALAGIAYLLCGGYCEKNSCISRNNHCDTRGTTAGAPKKFKNSIFQFQDKSKGT